MTPPVAALQLDESRVWHRFTPRHAEQTADFMGFPSRSGSLTDASREKERAFPLLFSPVLFLAPCTASECVSGINRTN